MTVPLRLTLILCALLTGQTIKAQTWQWMRNGVISNNITSYTTKNVLDDHGNTFCLSFAGNTILLSKYDPYGNLLWTKTIATSYAGSVTSAISCMCTDAGGNLYLISAPLTSIDGRPANTPSPYGLIKLDPNGRYV